MKIHEKKIFAGILFAAMSFSLMAQDIVTRADTDIYMFNPLPMGNDLRGRASYSACGPLYGGIMVQQYVPQDTVTVYGVALTMRNKNNKGSFININPTYRAVLMQRAAGTEDDCMFP